MPPPAEKKVRVSQGRCSGGGGGRKGLRAMKLADLLARASTTKGPEFVACMMAAPEPEPSGTCAPTVYCEAGAARQARMRKRCHPPPCCHQLDPSTYCLQRDAARAEACGFEPPDCCRHVRTVQKHGCSLERRPGEEFETLRRECGVEPLLPKDACRHQFSGGDGAQRAESALRALGL